MSSNQKTSAPGGLQNKLKNMTDTGLLLTITIVVFFLMYIGAMIFLGAGFRRPQMFFKILNDNAGLIILSCGLSLVMITQSIDISVGGVTALVSMCCAVYLDFKGGNVFMAVVIALAIGLGFGLVQGFLIAYLDIQPFIVTLAGMFFARGMTTIVNVNPFNVANEAFVALKNARVVIPGLGYMTKAGKYVRRSERRGPCAVPPLWRERCRSAGPERSASAGRRSSVKSVHRFQTPHRYRILWGPAPRRARSNRMRCR